MSESRQNIQKLSPLALRSALLILLLAFGSCGGGDSKSHVPINTGSGWSDSPFISRDGQRLYFMYSRYDFGSWIRSGGAFPLVASGPYRPGLHISDINPFDESDIYVATKNPDGTWSEAVNLGLNGAFGDSSGMEINNGNTFIWLHGNGSSNNIVMANRNTNGNWGAPIDLGANINDPAFVQDNPHISPDGISLWFTSSRPGSYGGKDIWSSSNSGGYWTAPLNSGVPVNTIGDEDQIWISPVAGAGGQDVYWNGPSGLMHCMSNGTNCTAPPAVVAIPGCGYAAEVSMPVDGQTMYFACADTTTFMVRIMYSTRQPNGSWGYATPVD